MADYTRCINALNRAAGKTLTDDELADVFNQIKATARDIAAGRVDAGQGMPAPATPEGVMRLAAEIRAKEIVAEKQRAVANAYRQVRIVAEQKALVSLIGGAKGIGPIEAVRRLIANDADGRANAFSLEARTHGVTKELQRKVQDTWLALGDDFAGFLQDKDKVRALLTEIKGGNSGDALAKKGAQAWLKTAEDARQWFNEIGGKVGKLDDWGMPQHHSQERVLRAGRDKWVADILPRIDRSKYVEVDGTPMTDAQVRDFLGKAWETIATNGVSKQEPGAFKGTGARSNRMAEERQIHFKDADALMGYWQDYGEKTMPDILMGHLGAIAKNISFVEHFGPNPDATYRMLRDEAMKAQTDAAGKLSDGKARVKAMAKAEKEVAKLDRLYDYASGKTAPVMNKGLAHGFNALHSLNVAGKLGSAFFASLYGDKVMFEAIGHVNNLPAFQRWYNEIRLLNPANAKERQILRQQGLMLEYMSDAMNRFGYELGSSSLTGKLATGVIRTSGMAAVNEWRRGAWALTAMDTLGSMVKAKDFAKIGPDDMRLMNSYGISETDWKVWKLAKLEDVGHGNDSALTPDAVGNISDADLKAANIIAQTATPAEAHAVRRDATTKLLGALTSESHLAVIEPGWNDRAKMYGGLQRGNIRDELTRSFWQFKAFPFAQFERMLDISLSRSSLGGKIGYMAAIPVMGTIAGAMMLQTQDLLSGKDPRPMGDWKFWAAASMKGGSLGLYGDFLYSQSATTRYGTGPLEAIAGPVIGGAADILKFAVQAGNQMATDPDAWNRSAARAVNIAKGYIPGQNLWMTKWATDHLIFQTAQEYLNPGYLSAMEDRTYQEFGQEWWLPPGASFNEMRSPDWGRALEGGR